MPTIKKTLTALAISSLAFNAYANASMEAQQCSTVRFADVGWTDITA
ncbi:glycine/betaine ABC transporter substrate-binding protein, partial [Vibrio genomosp. F10 str. 9ZD137]